jgi:WXG100 family type VII secretion target
MRVAVEPEALAEWSAHARRARVSLHTRLAALDDGLAPLAGTWHGDAAEGFAARHRQWHDAATGLVETLAALTDLVDGARANYLAADAANTRIWRAGSAAVLVHAMSAGRRRRITADLDDIRTAVGALVAAVADLGGAWIALGDALAGSGAMAGDDAGIAFGADYDAMAAAAWQGWRSSMLLVEGIAGGLAATGNNLAAAEAGSTAGPSQVSAPITVNTAPTPRSPPPPAAGGVGGGWASEYWPSADPARLRAAAAAWRGSAAGLREGAQRIFAAVDRLAQANPDRVLQEVREFTRNALSTDPTSGLTGVLAGTGGRIADACDGLADLTERTRDRLLDAVSGSDQQWYHPAGDVLDAFLRFKPGRVLAAAGDAYLLELNLSTIRDDHVRAVESLRGELHPAGADRLARIATAMVPPRPEPANTCLLVSPAGVVGAPVAEAQRQALIDEVTAAGHKISPAEVVQIARAPDGKVVWLERGDQRSGLSHILRAGRIANFVDRGIPPSDIPGIALRAVTEGRFVGQVREGGAAYEVGLADGRRSTVVVVVASNGYVVSARPLGSNDEVQA